MFNTTYKLQRKKTFFEEQTVQGIMGNATTRTKNIIYEL